MKSTKFLLLFQCSVLLATSNFALADEAYYNIPLTSLKLPPELSPAPDVNAPAHRRGIMSTRRWHVVLDGNGEVYINDPDVKPWRLMTTLSDKASICICTPKPADVKGRLFITKPEETNTTEINFQVSPADAKPEAKETFFQAKEFHYRMLLNQNVPGAAWFRHQAQEAAKNLGSKTNSQNDVRMFLLNQRASQLENTYELFTGGRALSENLQLDRVLPATKTADESVDITNLAGVTVTEMDWKGLIKDTKPDLDPLAAFLPADQHAIFFPSFQAMTQMIDEADANGTPVLQLLEPRSEDSNARTRYQKQLCLGLSDASRLLGPKVVSSVAFTGSDPFLRVGTDVAILFETRNPDLLMTFLGAQQKAAQTANAGVKPLKGNIAGVSYTGVASPDRSVSAYVASVSNVVLVCNSLKQLENLAQVAKGNAAPLSSRDEYVFFRNRYARTDANETAFVVLTDATIRRWCGPRWRIADSRRTRAAAAMTELQAAHLADLASGKATPATLSSNSNLPDAGEFQLTPAGVSSSVYGSLNFMTPITEIPLTRVTRAEADAYKRWCDSYQRNWRQFLDPIAIRFSVAQDRLEADLTVMPLIAATEYRQFIDISSGAQIAPYAGDPHTNSLVHLVFAINIQSPPVQEAGNFVGNMAPGLKTSPFGWMGQSMALYADDDPFWERLVQATNSDTFLEHNFADLPLALYCEVRNPLGLAAFLTALHAFADQSAPQMTTWQNLDYNGQAYVKVTSKSPEEEGEPKEFAIYYAATPRSLVVTLSEPLLKRALDRQAARAGSDGKELNPPVVSPWLGTNLCASAERKFIDVLQTLTKDTYQARLQLLAWNNLPILNEWKRLYPDKDPVKFHEQCWGTKLLCPGGGTYVWNEKWQTMESTVFGHPGEPRTNSSKALSEMLSARLGVSFENQGLSAKAVLNRSPKN
jgi:hypothetical protein